jgi:NAD(P)-dependent dehydrogenase (short-subunit alcohol dehydrogenase family)
MVWMKGKTVLVTGSTDGIGKQTALELARMGAHVLIHGRDAGRVLETVNEIADETGASVEGFTGDFASLDQVRRLAGEVAGEVSRLDVLINNAGSFFAERALTGDGFEMSWQVNHLSPYLLTMLLLDLLKQSAPARVVTVASSAHAHAKLDYDNLQGEKEYKGIRAYNLSKLGNVMATLYLSQKFAGSGVTFNYLHPGVVETKLLQASFKIPGIDRETGAKTSVYLACSTGVEGVSGKYFDECREIQPSPLALDLVERKHFMDVTEKMLGL